LPQLEITENVVLKLLEDTLDVLCCLDDDARGGKRLGEASEGLIELKGGSKVRKALEIVRCLWMIT